ncbi:MAG: hypothetical protein IIU50_03280 [Bacteroidaceae bacterium]|nr:hypothetical protein [Bacteroidaceae bacterium]
MKKIFFLIASALFIASCSSEKEELATPFQAGQEVTLNASIAGDDVPAGPQRVSGVDSNPGSTSGAINLTWDAGDQIQVTVGDKSAVFTLCSGAGSATGSFTGTMPAAGSSYTVVYPANYSESVLATQTYVPNGFGKGLMKMSTKIAGTIDGGFSLSADNALLGLQLTGDASLGKIVLTNPANSKTYTLNCSGVALTSDVKVFYIVVPAGTWANGFVVDVYASDNSTKIKTLSKGSSVTFSSASTMLMPSQAVEGGTQSVGFSVSATKKVTFSPGNLQYTQSTNTWSFAENQYDYIGTDNVTGGSVSTDVKWGDSKSGTALADKIDLFGWSTSANNFGITTSTMSEDYFGSFVDWGTNIIGSDAPNTWRTLTYDEWEYLLNTRPNASSLKGVAQVNGVNGLVFLPDNWTCPAGVTFTPGFHSEYSAGAYGQHQTFSAEQWYKLESAGAVFLPSVGDRYGFNVRYVQCDSYYWSATEYNENYIARCFYFESDKAKMERYSRSSGYPVRLVKDL